MKSFIFRLAFASAWNRRFTLGLTLASVALAAMLLIGIERIKGDARASFSEAVSGTDLVVGARTSPVALMLYSVFRIGAATDNVSWASVEMIKADPAVAWVVPLALGDSHRGFAVVGTSQDYFARSRHGDGEALRFAAGGAFKEIFEAVVGAEVAQRLSYQPGTRITLAHGSGNAPGAEHADKPFVVTGVLARTGTPVDRSVHVSLEAIEAIHLGWRGGAPLPGLVIPPQFVRKFDLTPKSATAVLVGLKSRAEVFEVQRRLNAHRGEALQAVMPAVALDELWQIMGTAERTLEAVAALVAAVAFAGLIAVVLAGLNERRRELAVLRAVGARPRDIFALLTIEGLIVSAGGVVLGLLALAVLGGLIGDTLLGGLGVNLRARLVSPEELPLLAAMLAAGCLASLVPGYRAYRLSLSDGLTPHT